MGTVLKCDARQHKQLLNLHRERAVGLKRSMPIISFISLIAAGGDFSGWMQKNARSALHFSTKDIGDRRVGHASDVVCVCDSVCGGPGGR